MTADEYLENKIRPCNEVHFITNAGVQAMLITDLYKIIESYHKAKLEEMVKKHVKSEWAVDPIDFSDYVKFRYVDFKVIEKEIKGE